MKDALLLTVLAAQQVVAADEKLGVATVMGAEDVAVVVGGGQGSNVEGRGRGWFRVGDEEGNVDLE